MGAMALGELIHSKPGVNELKGKAAKVSIVILILFLICPIIFVYSMTIWEEEDNTDFGWGDAPIIDFIQNVTAGTLTVKNVDPGGLDWMDFSVHYNNNYNSSTAILPSGTVNVGDVITNCSGIVTLNHNLTNTLIGSWYFPDSI